MRQTPKKAIHPLVYIHNPVRQAVGAVFFGGADFFFAKRLFFRNGEGGEWRASRVTVGVKAKDNGGACFTLDFDITPTKGRQPSHPHRGDFLFFSIQP